jgi:peroxiredoxin
VVGISYDPLEKLKSFQAQEQAPQRFVSDPKGAAAVAFDVSMTDQNQVFAKRATFIIRDGKVLHTVFDWSPLGNVSKTLAWLEGHPPAGTAAPALQGKAAPPIVAPIIANGEGAFDLSKQRGHGVYINFFASWCQPCQEEARTVAAAAREYSGSNVRVVGIAVLDTEKDAKSFARDYGLRYPIAFDASGSVGAAYRLAALPLHVFIGPDGVVRYYEPGGPISPAQLRAALDSIKR